MQFLSGDKLMLQASITLFSVFVKLNSDIMTAVFLLPW